MVVAVTFSAAAGFARVFADGRWVLPVVSTAVSVHAVSWGARRLHVARRWGLLAGGITVVAVGIWTVVGGTTVHGLPLGDTWRAIHAALDNARRVAPTVVAPVPDLTGFRLLAAWGVGIVALLADWAAFRLRSSLQALVPGFALFVVCCVLGTTSGRAWAVAAMVASMSAFLLVHRHTVGRAGTVWFANRDHRSVPWTAAVGTVVIALLGALIVVGNLSPTEGEGALGWKHGPGAAAGARSVISPIVDLRTRLVDDAATPVMTVASPVPSYWRLTSLDTFTGIQWQSTNSYLSIGHRLPGVGPPPPGDRQVTESFHLQTLDSIWLPAAFSPEAVTGGGHVTYDPVSGSLLTNRATANGLSYTVTSLQYLATLDSRALETAAPPPNDGSLAHSLTLPELPSGIHQLAATITARKRTEYDKALALQNFFLGPTFRYSLSPPTDGYGTDALSTFLFATRTGYCQQFAGAYAVLARSIGLPTRLAVGFTTGSPNGAGGYQVTDADAHTWPEVYFPGYGWLPFEPTKGGFAVPGATGYTGQTSTAAPGAPAPAPVLQAPAPPTDHAVAASPTAAAPPVTRAPASSRAPASALGRGLIAALALAGAALAWPALVSAGRALRWRRRRQRAALGDPDGTAEVLTIWAETEELLAWWGIRRRVSETFVEVARRAGSHLGARVPATSPGAATTGDVSGSRARSQLETLAGWASEADYGEGTLPPAAVDQARSAGRQLALSLRRAASVRLRLRWLSDPRLAWRGTRRS
jgi:transglutaminase-like putative cysteine protease